MEMSEMRIKVGLDPFGIAENVVSDEEMLAAWGPKYPCRGIYYKIQEQWIYEIEKLYAQAYGSEKVKNDTICESFARSFLAHKKGFTVDWARFSAEVEDGRNCIYGSGDPSKSEQKRPFRGYVAPNKVYCRKGKGRSNVRTRKSSALSDHGAQNKDNEGNIPIACNADYQPYINQINSVIQQLTCKIEGQQQLKARYQERSQNIKEALKSYSSVRQNAAEKVKACSSRIDELKAEIRNIGNMFAQDMAEICSLWQSGHDEEKLKEMLTKENHSIECVKKANLDLDACQNKLQENTFLDQTCKSIMDEQATALEEVAHRILIVDATIARLQDTLNVEEKHKQHLEKLPLSSEDRLANYIISPLPIYHPVLENTNAATIVITVSPCPICNLYFDSKTLDIIVAPCRHTFHPFCLVSDGNFLSHCPKCRFPLDDMWLKSFGIVRKRCHLQIKRIEEKTSTFGITHQAKQFPSAPKSGMENLLQSSSDTSSNDNEETLAELAAKLRRIDPLLRLL